MHKNGWSEKIHYRYRAAKAPAERIVKNQTTVVRSLKNATGVRRRAHRTQFRQAITEISRCILDRNRLSCEESEELCAPLTAMRRLDARIEPLFITIFNITLTASITSLLCCWWTMSEHIFCPYSKRTPLSKRKRRYTIEKS